MLTNVSKIPNLSECLSNGDLGTLVAEVGGWDLGGEEELVAGELGVEKTLGRRSLVTVSNRGVDLLKCSFSICLFERLIGGGLCDLRGGSRPSQRFERPPQLHRTVWQESLD